MLCCTHTISTTGTHKLPCCLPLAPSSLCADHSGVETLPCFTSAVTGQLGKWQRSGTRESGHLSFCSHISTTPQREAKDHRKRGIKREGETSKCGWWQEGLPGVSTPNATGPKSNSFSSPTPPLVTNEARNLVALREEASHPPSYSLKSSRPPRLTRHSRTRIPPQDKSVMSDLSALWSPP